MKHWFSDSSFNCMSDPYHECFRVTFSLCASNRFLCVQSASVTLNIFFPSLIWYIHCTCFHWKLTKLMFNTSLQYNAWTLIDVFVFQMHADFRMNKFLRVRILRAWYDYHSMLGILPCCLCLVQTCYTLCLCSYSLCFPISHLAVIYELITMGNFKTLQNLEGYLYLCNWEKDTWTPPPRDINVGCPQLLPSRNPKRRERRMRLSP